MYPMLKNRMLNELFHESVPILKKMIPIQCITQLKIGHHFYQKN